ncbi:MAG: RHS repeat-associated core domain-containing protein [Paludibacteraceae bacterium]
MGVSKYYGLDEQRIKSVHLTPDPSPGGEGRFIASQTRYYFGSYERTIKNNVIEEVDYISTPAGITAMRVYNDVEGLEKLYYLHTDNLGSIQAITNESKNIVASYYYTPWGGRVLLSGANITDRGYTFHEHLTEFGLINMNGRVYDPVLARFLSPDPYVQAPDYTQNFNRYSYCLNNPFKYVDPSGELVWFVPVIIGAAIGATSGAMIGHANGARGWNMVGYIAGGALIGGLSGGAAAGASVLGWSSWTVGAIAGGISGAGFNGLATNWDGMSMLKGAGIGALSGFVGGGLGSAIGGGWGAFAGGAAGSGISTLLNQDFKQGINWEQVGISALAGGLLSYGTYELTSYIGWKSGGNRMGDLDISYKQYKTMQADYQRSRFWGKEYGGFLMNDGSVQKFPSSWRNSHGIQPPDGSGITVPENVRAMYHTHWDAPGKTIWVDAMGNRVDNSSNPLDLLKSGVYQTTTARGHGAYDYVHVNSFVVNRYETTFNVGGTSTLSTINDNFLRYFTWFYLWAK